MTLLSLQDLAQGFLPQEPLTHASSPLNKDAHGHTWKQDRHTVTLSPVELCAVSKAIPGEKH